MTKWKRKEKQFDELFAFIGKATHQLGFLVMMWVGMLAVVATTVVVSVLGVQELLRRLTH